MKILRTPDSCFANLAGYDFAPNYCDVPSGEGEGEDLRIHYIDEGPQDAKEVILCMHGEPSWSYLYRKMIPPFVAAGFRVLAPDLVGFGRSDKPAEKTDYSYKRHIEWMSAWLEKILEKIDGKNLTLVCQDWGGLIGLRLVTAFPDRFARVVAANTGLPTGEGGASKAFEGWLEFSQSVPNFPVGQIVKGGTQKGLSDEEEAAYNAPFPDESYKSCARAFPTFVPITPEHDQAKENIEAWKILEAWDKPFLTAFSDQDPVSKGGDVFLQKRIAGAKGQPHTTIKGGGHFLQEDCGPELAQTIIDFVKSTG